MKTYIGSSLAAKIVCASSPAGAGCFFVWEKKRMRHPCIDHHISRAFFASEEEKSAGRRGQNRLLAARTSFQTC